MTHGPRILRCEVCGGPMGACPSEGQPGPGPDDLVTEDLAALFRNDDRRSGPVVSVEAGKS